MYKYIYRFLVLTLVVLNSTSLFAQSEYPGGVGNVQVWLKPDNNTIKTINPRSNQVDSWKNDPNATEKLVNFTYADVTGTNQRPILAKASHKMNFNDALVFDKTSFLASSTGIDGNQNVVTVFAIYIAEKGASDVRMYYTGFGSTNPTSGSTRKPSIGFTPNPKKTGGRVRVPASRDAKDGYETNTTALQMTLVPEVDVRPNIVFRFNGADFSTDVKGNNLEGAPKKALDLKGGITLGGASIASGKFFGQLGEFIAYNRVLTQGEINKIESYLATKYGITLDGAAYMSSYNTLFWPWGKTGVGYHNNVAGIFTDSGNADITVSRSTASGAALTVNTIGSEFEVGVGVTNEVPFPRDNSAIYWGTNIGQGYQSSKLNNQGGCGYSEILEGKYWLFKKTNLDSTTVEVRAGGEDFPYSGPGYDVKMLVAKTEEDARNQNWLAVIPGTFEGGELQEHLFRLPINSDELYITFGANVATTQCYACTISETGNFKFSSKTWTNGANSASGLTASNGLKMDVTYKTYSNGKETPKMQLSGYPRVSNGSLLETRFRGIKGSNDNYAVTTVAFKDGASFAKFNIYGIDRSGNSTDMVEVIGYCGNTTFRGSVSSSNNTSNKTYTVGGGIITGVKSSSITNKKGVATIEFPHEVTKIEIKHKIDYRTKTRGYQNIAIGDFELNCPRPANPNPDGIEYTLQAPAKVVSCTDFEYTFKVWNYACDARYVKIEDELPEGMFWVDGGVSSTEFAFKDAVFNNFENTRILSIDKVRLEPGTFTTVTARVRFKDDAIPGVYENRGKLTYTSVNEGKLLTIESCDYNNFNSCTSTKTEMVYQARVLSPEVSIEPIFEKCYREKGIITIKAKVKNLNPTIDFTNLNLVFTYNEEFIFKKFKSSGDEGTATKDEGIYSVDGLNINGGSTLELTYEVQALEFLALIETVTGNKYTNPRDVPDTDIAKVLDFGALVEVVGNSEDVCINASLEDVYAVLDPTIPFCGRDLSCYYPGLPGNVIKKNSDFVLMTTLDRSGRVPLVSENINAILYLESKTKGFVPTRMTDIEINNLVSPIAGMLVYDTTNKCMKLYNGKIWSCIVQSCPDN